MMKSEEEILMNLRLKEDNLRKWIGWVSDEQVARLEVEIETLRWVLNVFKGEY